MDVTIRKMDKKVGAVKITAEVKYPSGHKPREIIEKQLQLLDWAAEMNQTKLELSFTPQVVMRKVTMRCDKPKAKDYAVGLVTSSLKKEDQAKLFAIMEKGKAVEVIIREIHTGKPAAPAKKAGEK